MATISELNVRLGLLTKEFDRNLRNVERQLRTSGQRLSSLGSELTLAVSAPLAALGISAIQQAGNIESLKLAMVSTFETAGRSAAEATAEVEALRKSALAPGLDFEQAIAASIRLQGVGYSAEQARTSIEQMANAIALTGGTAQNLDSVTVQFSQMIAKGKVLAQDLRIIQENMPIVSRLMRDAFGTQNAEALQKMGVSGKEFVDKITAAAVVLPRVQGGIKNAIVNAGAAARQALAQLGESINKTFNISGLLNDFSAWLGEISTGFGQMSKASREAIIGIGAFAIALGPLIKVFGVINLLRAELVRFFRVTLVGALETAYIRTVALTRAFAALSATAQAFTVVGVALAIFTAAYAMGAFEKEVTSAEKAQMSLNEITRQANGDISEQRTKINELVAVLKDEKASLDEKKKALGLLQSIAPEQFRNLDIETAKTSQLDDAVNKYIDSLLRAAKAKRAFARLEEIDRLRESLIETADPGIWETLKNSVKSAGNSVVFAGLQANSQAANFVKLRDELDKESEALRGVIKENGGLVQAISGSNVATNKFSEGAKGATEKAKLYKDALASIAAVSQKGDVLGADVIGEQAKEIESQIERLIEGGFKPYSKEIQHLQELQRGLKSGPVAPFAALPTLPTPGAVQSVEPSSGDRAISDIGTAFESATNSANAFLSKSQQINDSIKNGIAPLISFGDALKLSFEGFAAGGSVITDVFASALQSIQSFAADGVTSLKTFAQAAIASSLQVAKAAAIEGIFNAVKGALRLPFPINLAAAAVAAGGAAALLNGLTNKIKPPKLAEGGVIRKPTLAMIGEYSGAASNPEIVAPESKLRNIFRQENGGHGYILSTNIAGNDLQLILERAQNRNQRIR